MDWEAALERHLELGIDKKNGKGMKAFRFLALPVHLQDLELLILPLKGGGLSKLCS